MKEYERILATYLHVDNRLLELETQAPGQEQKKGWHENRRLSDCAFFLMFFAQLEQLITEQALQLVKAKKAQTGHDIAWDIIDVKRLKDRFDDKLNLVLDKGSAEAAKIKVHKEIRDSVAHGTLSGVLPATLAMAQEVEIIAKRIQNKE